MAQRLGAINSQAIILLQVRGRIKRNRMSEKVGPSGTCISEHSLKLQNMGVVTGCLVAVISERPGYGVAAFIRAIAVRLVDFQPKIDRLTTIGGELKTHSVPGPILFRARIRAVWSDCWTAFKPCLGLPTREPVTC